MDVIGHDNGYAKAVAPFMIVDAAVENDVASPVRQHASKLRIECNEVRGNVALHVRQVAAVELHEGILSLRIARQEGISAKKTPMFPEDGIMERRTPSSAGGVAR